MKSVFLDTATIGKDVCLDKLKKFGPLELYPVTDESEALERCKDMDIVITNKVKLTGEMIEALPKLKLICLAATGMDNIDLKAAAACGVEVRNLKGYSTDSVAQLTLAMGLAHHTRLLEQNNFGKNHWQKDSLFTNLDHPFSELAGKSWGVVGLGDIGKRVAELAKAFGCKVSYFSTSGKNQNNEFQQVQLNELLKMDIISVHCPLNDMTRGLINQDNVNLIQDGAIVVNVARGGVIDERAIVDKFKTSNIRLGFDVASAEPIKADNPLLEIKDSPRLILTPHIAWSSLEARTRVVEGIYKNIKDWMAP